MPRDSAAADRPASYLVGTAAAFPLFFRDCTKPINQLPFSPSAKFPKSGSSCESRVNKQLFDPALEFRSDDADAALVGRYGADAAHGVRHAAQGRGLGTHAEHLDA